MAVVGALVFRGVRFVVYSIVLFECNCLNLQVDESVLLVTWRFESLLPGLFKGI